MLLSKLKIIVASALTLAISISTAQAADVTINLGYAAAEAVHTAFSPTNLKNWLKNILTAQ